jgi:hypothetical protein
VEGAIPLDNIEYYQTEAAKAEVKPLHSDVA